MDPMTFLEGEAISISFILQHNGETPVAVLFVVLQTDCHLSGTSIAS